MLAGWRELSTGISAILCCLLFLWLLYSHPTKEGKELEVGTCEITALDRDMSHPKRMIARQTARCACRRGQVAGTTKAKPACVDEAVKQPATPPVAQLLVYLLPQLSAEPVAEVAVPGKHKNNTLQLAQL
ncbi:hypothetical protein JD844_018241 [Phrynosoma platyrhinos]|uniref:Protein FAM19A5 n=1 Tax=Phrynosoma platyrhinos TaxID=52577 RepID=A0ABQ7SN45_PHRPL|nr:hypothetical protein JD844_018241 [Phrynosoma platyrhinos]